MIPCTPALRARLIAVAQELEAPDLLVRGARVWSPFTGEVAPADVAVCGDRIARVGPWAGPVGEGTEVLEAAGMVAVPGYVEPHTHPWPFANPLSLGEAAACRGTTCLVYDDLLLHLALGTDRLRALTRELSAASLPHVFWVARMASQSRFEGEEEVFSREAVTRLLREPHVLATGEMTRWTDFLDPERAPRLLEIVEDARALGKFADGHTAGASARRLPALAAAGLRSCHEAINAEEALDRLRQGLWVLLRNSSLRRDLPVLLPALEETGFADRLAYTTDGAKAHHVEEAGLTDHLLRLALGAGVPASTAYRMATLNPATFLRLEEDLGAVAPGRVAHVNLLRDLADPTPEVVVCRGRVAARGGQLLAPPPSASFPWRRHYAGGEPPVPRWEPETFLLPPGAPDPFPAGRLVNAVITREEPAPLELRGGRLWPRPAPAGDLHVLALTDRTGRWIARGIIGGFGPGLAALASTYTTNAGVVVLGQTPEAMAEALGRLADLGGGIVLLPRAGEPIAFPLPLAGIQRDGGFGSAARAARRFQEAVAACGYVHADPNYTLLFLSCDFLPDLRATQAGWVRIKTGEVLLPAEARL
ncbi:MAG: adenine deaminase C-terminal domain-containing protein [Thermodesulfobacteriota bacterium]